MAKMYEYYKTSLDKNQVIDLNISKQDPMMLFIDTRTRLQPPVTKRCIGLDWCTYQPFLDNWMDKWFMGFEKIPCNNREIDPDLGAE
jgi:hypothetical protein